MATFYHGSKQSGIKLLRPTQHIVGNEKPIVFATSDKLYAIAMIHGTGAEIAVSYSTNPKTNKKEMYCDELIPGALAAFDAAGYLYSLDSTNFFESPEGLESEYVSYKEAPVLQMTIIDNVMDELRKNGVHLVEYSDVPRSMAERGKQSGRPNVKQHAPERFT